MVTLNTAIPILPALRLEESVAFYQRLGFTVGYDDGDYAILSRDGVEVHLFVDSDLNPLENDGGCYFRVTEIEALFAACREAGARWRAGRSAATTQAIRAYDALLQPGPRPGGARVISPPETKPWGQREFALVDPSHNLLRFGEPSAPAAK